jgi:hypothetical protein
MARTVAPLFGFEARGQLGKALVYSSWRGVSYSRRMVIPANPNTIPQQDTRNIFRTANQFWLLSPAIMRAPWSAYASGKPFTNRNAFISKFVKAFRDPSGTGVPATDMMTILASPGAYGGLPPVSVNATGGAGTLTAVVAAPLAPSGWSVTEAQGIAFIDQDPAAPFTGRILSDVETTPSGQNYTLTFATPPAGDYVVAAWFMWEKSDGSTAFSISLNDTATVT